MGKQRKRIIITISIIFIVFIAAGLFAGNHFFNLALSSSSNKSDVINAPHNKIDTADASLGETPYQQGEKWLQQQGYEDDYLQSFDELKLRAMRISRNGSNKWAIVCHGYNAYASQMVYYAKRFHELGFNVLMPDARGHGESEGSYIGMGWHDRMDVIGWASQLISTHGNDIEIILFGVSMGGATVMMAAGEKLPANIKAIVEDCGYSSVYDEFSYQFRQLYKLPPFPVIHFASLVTGIRAGYTLGAASAIKQVAKSQTPILFIHGSEDTFVPPHMLDEVYAAAACDKQRLLVEGAGHGMSFRVAGEEYWNTVNGFLNKYLSR